MRKLILAVLAAASILAVPPTAQAQSNPSARPIPQGRPYLHQGEAQAALTGAYGSDCDICKIPGYQGFQWWNFVRYNGYDVCQQVRVNHGGAWDYYAFEAYYPSPSNTSLSQIWDALRAGPTSYPFCPSSGVT